MPCISKRGHKIRQKSVYILVRKSHTRSLSIVKIIICDGSFFRKYMYACGRHGTAVYHPASMLHSDVASVVTAHHARRPKTRTYCTKRPVADVSRRYRCIFSIFVNCIAAWSAKKWNTRCTVHVLELTKRLVVLYQ